MIPSAQKLAESLEILKHFQDKGIVAIQTQNISRTHRERLLKNGFLQNVIKGWYMPSHPDIQTGESTTWYTSFWKFCRDYLNERFYDNWCLSPEQSICLHTDNWSVPKQLLVRSAKGGNKPTQLLFDTSIIDVRLEIPDKKNIKVLDGIRIFSLPAALISCSASFFSLSPIEAKAGLSMIKDESELLRLLITGGHSVVAGRLAGGFRHIGNNETADNIIKTMRTAGFNAYKKDPFNEPSPPITVREIPPSVIRLIMVWEKMKSAIADNFPPAPGIPEDKKKYLKTIDEVFITDAYHSLSIEGYRVSSELIKKIQIGNWKPEESEQDRSHIDALAARGYWQAFQQVKQGVIKALDKHSPGKIVKENQRNWYQELFGPAVTAGTIDGSILAGYRNHPVYIRHSRHVPPNYDAIPDLMQKFFELLEKENIPSVRIVLGHFLFVYIHPYIDGNGRIARFLMNVMFAAGGYPWTVIPIEKRNMYMETLEAASVEQNIIPFTKFIADLVVKQKNLIT